jgi:hypothetical protein
LYPGPGRNATLAAWSGDLAAGAQVELAFAQPFDLASLGVAWRPANATNATVALQAPSGEAMLPPVPDPAQGPWRAVLHASATGDVHHVTLAIRGLGK